MIYRTQSKLPKETVTQEEIIVRQLGQRLIADIPLEELKKLINYTTRELHAEGNILFQAEVSIFDKQNNIWNG